MKKLLFVAMAVIAMLVSCKPDTKVPTISNVSQNPEIVVADQEVTVTATVTGAEEFTIKLYFTVNADSYEADMIPANELNAYKAVIPGQADGAKVTYYIQVVAGEAVVKTDVYDYLVGKGETPEPSTDYSNLVLNELNGSDKFIEIYNKGDKDLSMEGLYLIKDEEEDVIWTGVASIVVPAKGYVVLVSKKASNAGEVEPEYVFQSGLSAAKTLHMALYLEDGTLVDAYVRGVAPWGETIEDVGTKSFARTPDGVGEWKLADSTPGAPNPNEGSEIPQE